MPTRWLLRSVSLTVPSKFVVTATISVAFVFIPRPKISNASRSRYWLSPLEHSIRSIFQFTREILQRNGPTDGTPTPETASPEKARGRRSGLAAVAMGASGGAGRRFRLKIFSRQPRARFHGIRNADEAVQDGALGQRELRGEVVVGRVAFMQGAVVGGLVGGALSGCPAFVTAQARVPDAVRDFT